MYIDVIIYAFLSNFSVTITIKSFIISMYSIKQTITRRDECMLIKDIQDLYELKVDVTRRIVYEKFKGMFTKEAVSRIQNDYATKILPLFKDKKWAKYCDMRDYRLANSQDELNAFVQYCTDNGMAHAALIVESAIVKMQMNRVGRNVGVNPVAFTDENEAEAYLKECGY